MKGREGANSDGESQNLEFQGEADMRDYQRIEVPFEIGTKEVSKES